MITKEYEGKNEKEAIKTAVEELGVPEEQLQIEVVQKSKGGFLGKSRNAVVKVVFDENGEAPADSSVAANDGEVSAGDIDMYEDATLDFLVGLFNGMDFDVDIEVFDSKDEKVFINLKSPDSALIIGKRGKTLEAIQMLTNIIASRKSSRNFKSVIDIENYRQKREDVLTDLALRVADEVKRTGKTKSLEPMNPFERRLIHLALQEENGVETKSEGDGIYRKVCVIPK